MVSEKFFKEKIYRRMHKLTWFSLYKSIINRIIKEIRFHKFNLPKFLCIMHFSDEITQSTKGKEPVLFLSNLTKAISLGQV